MKTTFIMTAAVAILAIGCDQRREARTDRVLESEKDAVQKSVREAKSEVDKQAKAQKDILEAEAKAAQAKIDAEKARVKAESADAQAKVDAASQAIRDAGSAGVRVQTEAGAGKSTVTAPPAEATPPVAPPPTTPTATTSPNTAELDQKLTEQVRTAVLGGGDENAGARTIQVTVSGGTATLQGTVKSEAEKAQAEQKAKAVAGVTKVDNQLQVKAE